MNNSRIEEIKQRALDGLNVHPDDALDLIGQVKALTGCLMQIHKATKGQIKYVKFSDDRVHRVTVKPFYHTSSWDEEGFDPMSCLVRGWDFDASDFNFNPETDL